MCVLDICLNKNSNNNNSSSLAVFCMPPRQRVGGHINLPLSVRIQILVLFGYLLLQFWSYSFNILQDVYTHNRGVHVDRILMVKRRHHLCLTDTLHFQKITPNKTTLSIIIKCGGILLFQFVWPLRSPSFFDLRIGITPLVSSKSSYRECITSK